MKKKKDYIKKGEQMPKEYNIKLIKTTRPGMDLALTVDDKTVIYFAVANDRIEFEIPDASLFHAQDVIKKFSIYLCPF